MHRPVHGTLLVFSIRQPTQVLTASSISTVADGTLVSTVRGSSTLGNLFNGSDFTADTQLGGTVLNCSAVRP